MLPELLLSRERVSIGLRELRGVYTGGPRADARSIYRHFLSLRATLTRWLAAPVGDFTGFGNPAIDRGRQCVPWLSVGDECIPPKAGKLNLTRPWRAGSSHSRFVNPDINTLYVLRGLKHRKRHVGITNELSGRLAEHRSGTSQGSQLIEEFEPILTGHYPTYSAAREREKFPKSGQDRHWLDKAFGKWPDADVDSERSRSSHGRHGGV